MLSFFKLFMSQLLTGEGKWESNPPGHFLNILSLVLQTRRNTSSIPPIQSKTNDYIWFYAAEKLPGFIRREGKTRERFKSVNHGLHSLLSRDTSTRFLALLQPKPVLYTLTSVTVNNTIHLLFVFEYLYVVKALDYVI